MLRQKDWTNKNPYHYLMEILVEKYTQLLERENTIGDILVEARQDKQNKALEESYKSVKKNGTYFVSASRMQSQIRATKLKFRSKKDNIAGLQLCDLIAHPSHIYVRKMMGHDVELGPFAKQIVEILNDQKYDRSSTGKIKGYGIKHYPQ